MNKAWMWRVWEWWKQREKENELRQRWMNVFGSKLARSGEDGNEICLRSLERIIDAYQEGFRRALWKVRLLEAAHPPLKDPTLVWADVHAARQELSDLTKRWESVRLLIKEARVVPEDAIPPAMEVPADQT